jgi:hypothetical protein
MVCSFCFGSFCEMHAQDHQNTNSSTLSPHVCHAISLDDERHEGKLVHELICLRASNSIDSSSDCISSILKRGESKLAQVDDRLRIMESLQQTVKVQEASLVTEISEYFEKVLTRNMPSLFE